MKRIFGLLTLTTFVGLGVTAAPLSPEQALSRALSDGPRNVKSVNQQTLTLTHTQVMDNGAVSAYIFSKENNNGFLVISADDNAVPVLGYSERGSIDKDNLPPSFLAWLDQYGRQVQWLNDNGLAVKNAKAYAPSSWTAVEPLLKTVWNQDAPYNNLCPVIGGSPAPTGCVATSLAQVMNYFQYPVKGKGNIRYRDGEVYRTMTFTKPFEWNLMLDDYVKGKYTDEQANAVAYLMQGCGYTVEMRYTASSSGTNSYKLMNAITEYFGYAGDVFYRDREIFSADQWAQLVYDNIKKVGPVIYDGFSIDGGHSFVCDGYDGNGYFHFNWGWGGLSDGYFILEVLNPDSQGIGGASGGFNYMQSALFNMHTPDTEGLDVNDYANIKIYGNVYPLMDGNTITFKNRGGEVNAWGNVTWKDASVQMGVIIETLDGTTVREVLADLEDASSNVLEMHPAGYYLSESDPNRPGVKPVNPYIEVPQGLADGNYKIVLAAREYGTMSDGENYPWQPMVPVYGNVNYCWMTVENGKVSVSAASPAELTFGEGGLVSKLYVDRNALLNVEIANNSDDQLTKCVYVALVRNGFMQYRSDYDLVSVDAGETVDHEIVATFFEVAGATHTGAGTYTVMLLQAGSNQILANYGEYEMEIISKGFTLKLDELNIPDVKREDVTVGSRTFKDAFIVNSETFDIDFGYTVTKGYLDSSVRIIMSEYDAENNKTVSTGVNYYYDVPFLGEGESKNVVVPMNMSPYKSGSVYVITATYLRSGQNVTLGNIFVSYTNTGIEGIVEDAGFVAPEYYNLQGVRIDRPAKGQIVVRRIGNKTEKIVF